MLHRCRRALSAASSSARRSRSPMRETGTGRGPTGWRPGVGAEIEDMVDVLLPERFQCG